MVQLVLLLLANVVTNALDHDLEYVAALRKSKFYRLSERKAEQLLADSTLTSQDRSRIVVELSKTLAAQALNSRPPERDTYWQRATEVLAAESQKQPNAASQLVLESQQAFIYEQQSAWTVRETELRANNDADWNAARTQLRQAIRSLKQVETTLSSPAMRRQNTLPDTQLQSIQRNIQFQLGNAFLHQAVTYRESPRDRTNALTQALRYFRDLGASRLLDDITWQSRLGRVRCARMLGQYAQAQQLLQSWNTAPADQLGGIAAESIRLALDVRQLEAAIQLANSPAGDSQDPEFQLARIEAYVAAAEQLRGQPRAKTAQQQASLVAADLEQEHGTYWALRGELLLSRLASDENADVSLLNTAAEAMLRKDAPESAKQMFLEAAERASENEDAEAAQQAFAFLYKAAIVDHREGHLQSALEQFQRVATQYPDHPQAAEAHLLAVFDAAGLYQQYAKSDPSQLQSALSQYEALLHDHLRRWPGDATADQARMWAAKLALAKRDWLAAARLYQAIPVDSEFELPAYRGLAQSITQWITTTHPTAADIQDLRSWMQNRLGDVTADQARAALAIETAKVAMLPPEDYTLATSVLKTLWPAEEAYDQETSQQIGLLLVVAATGDRRMATARNVFTQLVPLPPKSLMQLLRGLQPIRQKRIDDNDVRALSLELIELLKPYHDQLSDEDLAVLQRTVADYLPVEQAVMQYATYAKESPRDFEIQKRYAELLTQLDTRESRETALQQWRRVAQLAKAQSPAWFAAKLAVAQTHLAMGNRQEARDLIDYLAALYPDLGGPELKQAFERLRR